MGLAYWERSQGSWRDCSLAWSTMPLELSSASWWICRPLPFHEFWWGQCCARKDSGCSGWRAENGCRFWMISRSCLFPVGIHSGTGWSRVTIVGYRETAGEYNETILLQANFHPPHLHRYILFPSLHLCPWAISRNPQKWWPVCAAWWPSRWCSSCFG